MYKLNLRNHGKQHGGFEARWMNPALGQWWASPDAGQINPTGQWPGSYSSVRKLLVLIIKGGICWWGKKNSHEKITMTLTQTICPDRITLRAGKKGACSAEVGALAPEFEKSATEHKQKFLKCKSTIHIATFNVRTLNRIDQSVCVHEYRFHHNKLEIKYHYTGNGGTFLCICMLKLCQCRVCRNVSQSMHPKIT